MRMEMIAYFYIYSFVGWALEVIFNALTRGIFVKAGMLYGPWCPIYGLGMLAIIRILKPLRDHLGLLFLGSVPNLQCSGTGHWTPL